MTTIKRKICMLGAAGVGKTSLVSRFVYSIFPNSYLTTVGVKITRKSVQVGGVDCELMLWDLAGEDEFVTAPLFHVNGAHGYLLVIDATRRETLDTALDLYNRAMAVAKIEPFVVVLNKVDLGGQWEVTDADEQSLAARGWKVIRTSAKTGEGVELAFSALAEMMLASEPLQTAQGERL